MELPRLHVQWIEREIASISSETEKHALQKARVELATSDLYGIVDQRTATSCLLTGET